MIPAPYYKEIDLYLNSDPGYHGGNKYFQISDNHDFLGFIFFDQNFSHDALNDFISNIQHLHQSSGDHVHFLLPGISMYGKNNGEHAKMLGELDGISLYHNTSAFLSFSAEFERQIKGWEFDVGVKVVFIDIKTIAGIRELDFENTISFDVDAMIEVGIINRTSELLGKIIRFKKNSELSSAGAIRNKFKFVFGKNWVKGLLLAVFPNSIKKLATGSAVLDGGKPIIS